ncbi:cryptochrome/photolyase family protein [Rickettsiales bacterium]|nr:cryptochrome/photolyase family protein [Rickettsiales bacterium]
MSKKIILILNDHLNLESNAIKLYQEGDLILMCENYQDFRKHNHHKKKLVFIFSSMRHFAAKIIEQKYNLHYLKIEDKNNSGILTEEIIKTARKYNYNEIILEHPSDYETLTNIKSLENQNIKINILEDSKFLCTIEEFKQLNVNKKTMLMENFYRKMRKKHNILMDKDKPDGGSWNYDKLNREKITESKNIPTRYKAKNDQITLQVIDLINAEYPKNFGEIVNFDLAVTREESLLIFRQFLQERIENFGQYQDAMLEEDDFLYHSHISFYVNNGLLKPLELIKEVEKLYKENKVKINSAEGFIRQILGWREYVRGIYWHKMPEYKKLNFLEARNKLPAFYWDANTKMNCLKKCVTTTIKNSYAHHIQRLMVLGNFALLSFIDPKEVNEWFLCVYADAYEWVEMPNVTGMILFADGGYLASKPYAASGAYINKMSNYCKNCHYDVKLKNGSKACPFNYLYWNFMIQNKERIGKNHRLAIAYNTLSKFNEEKIHNITKDSKNFLKNYE